MAKLTRMDGKMLGDRLRECRESKGWSQETLAEKVDTSSMTVSRYENGTKYSLGDKTGRKWVIAFGKALGVRREYLLGLDDYKTEDELNRSFQVAGIKEGYESFQGALAYIKAMGLNYVIQDGDDPTIPYGFTNKDGDLIIDLSDPARDQRLREVFHEIYNYGKYMIEKFIKEENENGKP